jgi:hypothetical protein
VSVRHAEFEAVWAVKILVFWDVAHVEVLLFFVPDPEDGGTTLLRNAGNSLHSTPVNIPEHRCENLKFRSAVFLLL